MRVTHSPQRATRDRMSSSATHLWYMHREGGYPFLFYLEAAAKDEEGALFVRVDNVGGEIVVFAHVDA